MTKYAVKDLAPKALGDKEMVIYMPDFIPEMREVKLRIPHSDQAMLTEANALRKVLVLIDMRYAPDENRFNAYHLPIGNYEGLEYHSERELSDIVMRIVNRYGSQVVDAYIDKKIKDRPLDTELIYFVGPESKSTLFSDNGIDLASTKKTTKKKDKVTE